MGKWLENTQCSCGRDARSCPEVEGASGVRVLEGCLGDVCVSVCVFGRGGCTVDISGGCSEGVDILNPGSSLSIGLIRFPEGCQQQSNTEPKSRRGVEWLQGKE